MTAIFKKSPDRLATASLFAGHALHHVYDYGLYVILPVLYTELGLTPVAAGLMDTVRRVSSGVAAIGGGFLVDQLQHRRILILCLSMLTMGLGYLIVGLAPAYLLILVALGLVGISHQSLWHPSALSLLSQRYPERRGFMISMHRSSGNLGDAIGSLAVGALMLVLAWQGILLAAFPMAVGIALLLWLGIRQAPGWEEFETRTKTRRDVGEQLHSLRELFRTKGLLLLFLLASLSGLGQGGFQLWLPIYLHETQGMGTFGIGLHMALLTSMGLAFGPLIGALSDRFSRKPMIVMLLAGKAIVAALMVFFGGGLMLTMFVGLMGVFMFAGHALIDAGALDLGEGRRLEGSLVGILWGNNALFLGFAPVIVGLLMTSFGYSTVFWYMAVMNGVGSLVAFILPAFGRHSASMGKAPQQVEG
ncbi:MAG: MFS transporter [Candidatus Binatia bacterium]|nr:MFS transporter [Candidatus Binatia bacterium]